MKLPEIKSESRLQFVLAFERYFSLLNNLIIIIIIIIVSCFLRLRGRLEREKKFRIGCSSDSTSSIDLNLQCTVAEFSSWLGVQAANRMNRMRKYFLPKNRIPKIYIYVIAIINNSISFHSWFDCYYCSLVIMLTANFQLAAKHTQFLVILYLNNVLQNFSFNSDWIPPDCK